MSLPVPITQPRPPLAPFRPPPLRHETDSSNSEVDDQTSPAPPSLQPSHPPPVRYFSPASHGSSFSSTGSLGGSGSRPSSLPLPPLQQSAYLRPPLVSPRELLNPMSIASALADTAADGPMHQRGGGTGSSISGGMPSSAHHRVNPLPPDVPHSHHDQYGGGAGRINMSSGSYSGGHIPPMLPHRRSSSATSPYPNQQQSQQQFHQHQQYPTHQHGSPYGGHHGRSPYPVDLGGSGGGGDGMFTSGMPPPVGLMGSPDETRHIVERLRAMDQSLREANLAQRRLVDETMRSWNSDDGK